MHPLPSVSQFSDNGLVQFQSVDENQQYLFPAPSASGFPGHVNASLLAAFWDDADLTHGGGRLLYQVRCIDLHRGILRPAEPLIISVRPVI